MISDIASTTFPRNLIQKYIRKKHLGLLTETNEVLYFGSLKPQIFMYSRWRHPPKTVSTRPYCRSRRGRNGLGSETINRTEPVGAIVIMKHNYILKCEHKIAVITLLCLLNCTSHIKSTSIYTRPYDI